MRPTVSVVIPVYQVCEYLSDCLNSIIHQSYKELEIIVVDDGSDDGSETICDLYALRDSRIHVIHQANGGLSAARNTGIDASHGDYITFVDSDDVVSANMIAEMIDLAVKEDADVVKIGVIRKNSYAECNEILKEYTVHTGFEALHLLFNSNSQIVCGCGKLFRASTIADTRFPAGRYYEDEYFVPRIYAKSKKVVLSDSELYYYMQRENDSILRGLFTPKKALDSLWISQDRLSFFSSLEDSALLREATIDYYYKIQSLLVRTDTTGDPSLASVYVELMNQRRAFARNHSFLFLHISLLHIAHRIKTMFRGNPG